MQYTNAGLKKLRVEHEREVSTWIR